MSIGEYLPEACAIACYMDQNSLVTSNYEGLGKETFDIIQLATKKAIDSMAFLTITSIFSEMNTCNVFTNGVNKFFEEMQKAPDIARSVRKLPKYTECALLNQANLIEKFNKNGKAFITMQYLPINFLLLTGSFLILRSGSRPFLNGVGQSQSQKMRNIFKATSGAIFSWIFLKNIIVNIHFLAQSYFSNSSKI